MMNGKLMHLSLSLQLRFGGGSSNNDKDDPLALIHTTCCTRNSTPCCMGVQQIFELARCPYSQGLMLKAMFRVSFQMISCYVTQCFKNQNQTRNQSRVNSESELESVMNRPNRFSINRFFFKCIKYLNFNK